MTKLSVMFWLGLVLTSFFAMFAVKYGVQNLEDQLAHVRKQTIAEEQETRVLNAEWTYLNQPERLADLNRRFVQLVPISPRQLQQRVEDIPLRPPVETPDAVIAAAPVPSAPRANPALSAAAPLPVAAAAFRPSTAGPAAAPGLPLRLAASTPASLDALIAQISGPR
jgi:hypothetical protein